MVTYQYSNGMDRFSGPENMNLAIPFATNGAYDGEAALDLGSRKTWQPLDRNSHDYAQMANGVPAH